MLFPSGTLKNFLKIKNLPLAARGQGLIFDKIFSAQISLIEKVINHLKN